MVVANKDVSKRALCERGRKAIVEVLACVGDKWTVMILAALSDEPMRYSELQRHIGGISQRMLTLTLKGLTEDGLVNRTVYPTIPPRVDYELTGLGRSLRESILPLRDWAIENMHSVVTSRMAARATENSQTRTISR